MLSSRTCTCTSLLPLADYCSILRDIKGCDQKNTDDDDMWPGVHVHVDIGHTRSLNTGESSCQFQTTCSVEISRVGYLHVHDCTLP